MKLKIINNINEMSKKQIIKFFDGNYNFLQLLNDAFLIVRYIDKKSDVIANNVNKPASFMYNQANNASTSSIYGKAILVTNYTVKKEK